MNGPRVIRCASATEAATRTAGLVADLLATDPTPVIGFATGGSMVPVLARLVAAHREGRIGFAGASGLNLDEYTGLPADHPQSYRTYMRRHLYDHVDIDPGRCHLPEGTAPDAHAAAAAYEALARRIGPPDLQLLGIGANGHIGFNEPGSGFASRTRAVDLSDATLAANARFFGPGEVQPTRAITLGIGNILEARRIVLLACGASKATAVARALTGPVTEDCPASALRRHPDVTFVLDPAAASRLPRSGEDAAFDAPDRDTAVG